MGKIILGLGTKEGIEDLVLTYMTKINKKKTFSTTLNTECIVTEYPERVVTEYPSYFGCAVGKAKQAAKTEIEKLKLADMSVKNLIKEAARIIYVVHDELKDKQFELELSWVSKDTNGRHQLVSKEVAAEAETFAKQALADIEDSDDGEM